MESTEKYKCLVNINHNGQFYNHGSIIELGAAEANLLLLSHAVELIEGSVQSSDAEEMEKFILDQAKTIDTLNGEIKTIAVAREELEIALAQAKETIKTLQTEIDSLKSAPVETPKSSKKSKVE